jgi:hypothetical protein
MGLLSYVCSCFRAQKRRGVCFPIPTLQATTTGSRRDPPPAEDRAQPGEPLEPRTSPLDSAFAQPQVAAVASKQAPEGAHNDLTGPVSTSQSHPPPASAAAQQTLCRSHLHCVGSSSTHSPWYTAKESNLPQPPYQSGVRDQRTSRACARFRPRERHEYTRDSNGWVGRIRTYIARFRALHPAVRRPPNGGGCGNRTHLPELMRLVSSPDDQSAMAPRPGFEPGLPG